MDIDSIIKSGNALNEVIDGWKESAIEYIVKLLKSRRKNGIIVKFYNSSISPKIKDVSICGCEKKGILSINLVRESSFDYECDDYFMVEDADENWHNSYDLTHNDLLKILKIVKAVQKADESAKDY